MKISSVLLSFSLLLAGASASAQDYSSFGLPESANCSHEGPTVNVDTSANARSHTVDASLLGIQENDILIVRKEFALYYGLGHGLALKFKVGLPQSGLNWKGPTTVHRKCRWPDWSPPGIVARRHPEYSEGMIVPGGTPRNPMGAAALVLADHEAAIHGTRDDMRASMGTPASMGCIRMLNEDVVTLYDFVREGDRVCMSSTAEKAAADCRSYEKVTQFRGPLKTWQY